MGNKCPGCGFETASGWPEGSLLSCEKPCGTYWQVGAKEDEQFGDRIYKADKPMSPSGGIKYDDSKPMVALIPPHALTEEAKVWTFGMKKYEAFNWSKGFKYTRVLSAMLRHTIAIMMGEDRDAESGCLHAAHVRCCAAMLIEFTVQNRTELDDRIYSKESK